MLLDVVAHEMHQNDHTYVAMWASAEPTFGLLSKNLAWWAVTWKTSRKHKTVKIWGWALFLEQYGNCNLDTSINPILKPY